MNRVLIFWVLTCCHSVASAADVASARLDLRQFGYQFNGSTSVFSDYTDLGFLSEDLVLVSINQRGFGPVEPLFADTPNSIVLVLDLKRGSVLATRKMSVEKLSGSVQVVKGERFAVLNQKGLQFCDATLKCGPPIETQGPMFVSPQGKWIAVGGGGRSRQTVFDTESLKQVAVFERGRLFQQVIPGEGAFLVDKNNAVSIQRPGKQDARLNTDSRGFQELRFLQF